MFVICSMYNCESECKVVWQSGRPILVSVKGPFHREQDRWKTAERPWNLLDLSMVFQWTFNDLRGLSRFLTDLSVVFVVSVVSKTFWNGSKQSFSGLSGKWSFSGLSAVFQRSLNELSKVLLVFPWSFDSLCYLVLSESLQQSRSVFQSSLGGLGQSFRVLSVVSVSLSEILIDLSKISGSMPDDLSVISQ